MACGRQSKKKIKKDRREKEREREAAEKKPIVLNTRRVCLYKYARWVAAARSDARRCNSRFHNTDVKK